MLAVCAAGTLLAVAGPSQDVTLWTLPEGEKRWSLSLTAKVARVEFSKDAAAVIVHGQDGSTQAFSIADGTLLSKVPNQQ
jgi:hypothetical protein